MSGGHFNYEQCHICNIAEEIEDIIYHNGSADNGYNFKPKTINEFQKALHILNQAYVYVHRIDWLISDDDGEGTFHRRLAEDLSRIKKWDR